MAYKYEKNYNGGQDIVIDGWEKGISTTPYSGITDVRCANVSDIPGAVFANAGTTNDIASTNSNPHLGLTKTFTADASTDQITITAITNEFEYTAVTFTNSGGGLPGGLATSTTYYLRYISSGIYKVATSLANAISGTYVNITSAGTGTQSVISTDIGIIRASTKDDRTGNIYAVDENNRVWCSNIPGGSYKWMLVSGNTLTSGNGNGIAVWQNYLFVFRSASIDVFGGLDNLVTATWTNGWKSLNASGGYNGLHRTFIASNNILYWTDYTYNTGSGRNPGYIGSLNLTSTTAFDPATSSTYTYNYQALDLPDNEQPVALNELNGYLVIGVNMSGTNSSGNTSKIYYWDTTSPSFQIPLIIPEAPIYEIVNANNIIYIFCGWRGRVYKTNLSTIALAFKIPDHLYYPTTYGKEGLPLFGVVAQEGAGGGYKITFGYQARVSRRKILFCVNLYGSTALYSYDIETNLLQIDAKPTNGYGTSSASSTQLYAVETLNAQTSASTLGTEIIFFGDYYASSTYTYTIDRYNPITSNNDVYFSSYNASIITDFINTGSTLNKKTFAQLEYILDRDMVSGSGLKIYYRSKIGESWTLLSTEDYSTYGAINSRVISFPLSKVNFVQLKIELNPYTVLRQIRLR
jgi:hypothetical protein